MLFDMSVDDIPLGKYRHYKTHQYYEVMGLARHSETKEMMVIYRALYLCSQWGHYQTWVRSKEMFFGLVNYEGRIVPRFEKVKE